MHAPRSFLTLFGVIFAFFLNAATNLHSEDDFPISKDNLQLWLDANAGIVTDENGKVERWEDQSGKGNHAYQLNAANRPAIGVDAQSHRSVTFAAYSRQSLILPGVLKDASSGEMLIVLKSTAPARETRVLGQLGFSNRSDYYPDSYGAIYSGFGSSVNVYMGYPRININQWHLFNISAKAGSWMARLNGLKQHTWSPGTPSFTGMLSLGGNADPGYSYTYFFDGNISGILVFDRTLSDPERMLIEQYIHDKTQMLQRPPPVAPSNLTAQNLGAGEVCLTWNNGADKSIASEYTVERNLNNTGWVTIGTLEGSADYYIDSVSHAGNYDYRIRIRNWDGESEYSDEAHISVQTGSSYSLPREGLALWLRADVGISLDSDNKVENWANVGGQGGAATQSDAAIRPSRETDEFGNQMVSFASFEAASVPKALQLSAVMRGANAGEIFAVLKSRSNASSAYSQVLWRMGSSYDLYPAKNGLFASCFGTDTSRAAGDANMDVSKWHVYNTASKAGEWTARLNGRLLYRTTNNTPNFSYDMQIGLSSYSYSTMPFNGDIAEIVMYDRVLDDAEREAVELYLGARLKQQAAPAAPTDVRAKIVGDTVEVSWFSAHDDGWSRYEVERKNDSGVFEKIGVVGGDDRTYVDANIQPGRAYAYQVRKTTWAGTSSDDNEVSIETPARLGMALPKNGLRLWMKADAGVIASPSGAVNTWLDQSGFSNHGTQLSSSNQPAIDVTAQNRKVVFSANSNQTLGFGGILQEPKAGEYFVVYKSTASPTANGRALWAWDDYCPDFGGNFKSGFLTKTTRTFARPPARESWHIYNISSKPDEWTVRVNGIEHYKTLKNEIYPVSSYSATLGGIPNAGACLDAEVAEVLIYDRVLDGAEREAVGAYLSARHESLDVQPPAAPPLTSKEAGRGQIAVTWDAPEERAWVEYVLERSDGGDTWTVVARMQAGSRGYIDSNLTAGTYHYRMKVRNWAGESAYSDDVTTTLTQASAATLPVSGLSLWLRADTGVIAGDDGTVESWNDLSGRGFNATQPAAASRPVAAMSGTRHAVRFDRAKNQRLILPTVLPEGAQRGEIFAILKAGAAKPSATTGLWTWGSGGSFYPTNNGRIYESFGSGAIDLGMPCTDISQWHSYNVAAAAGDWVVRLNGLVQYRTIARNDNPVFPSAPQIGYANGYYFDGDIAEILVFDRVLDAAERAALETYAQERLQFIADPEAPLNLRAAPGAYGQIDLLWDSDPETGWTEYVIERKAAEAPLTEFAGVARVATHGWSDDTVTPGQKYVYRVKALSRTAGSDWSDDAEAVAPVKPSDVALPAHEGLRLWLRAGMGTVVDSDSRVKSWMDLSGKGNNLDQFDPAFRPLLASENGGRPSVRFSSARKDNFSLREIMQNAGAGEAFVVVKAASARPSSPGRGLWRLGNSNNNNAFYYPNSSGQLSDDFGRGAIQNMGNPVADIGQWHVYNVSASPESWIARLNGIEQHRAGSGAVGWHATPLLGGNGSYYFDGEIAEILIYDRVLDDGERIALHRYLMAATDVTPEPVPDAPSALDAQSDTPDAVRVSWQLPETFTQGGSYVLKRQTGAGAYEEVFRFNAGYETHMDYTDHDVAPGQEYTYCMMAVDWRGRESADSDTATVTVPASTGETALEMRAGLRLWLRSDFGMVRTPDGYVAIWKDQSGLDNHATQGTPANRPALPASDNMPMSFDAGKSQYFTLPSSLVEGAVSGEAYVIVRAKNAKSSSTRGLWRLGASSYYPYPSSGVIHDGFGSTSGHPMGTPVLDIADWRVYNVSSTAGSWTARLDGVEQYATTTNTVGWGNSLALGLGESYFDGEIAEILIFDRILDTTERESVNRYLLSRAGLPEGAGPTAPTIEAWSENPDAINVEWQLPATHDCGIEYILERESGDSGFSEILSFAGGFAARRDYTDWNVSAGQTYTYRMKARDWLGRESAYGNKASVTVPGGPAPDVLPVRAGLALWLRVDAGILGASDGRVTVWEDQSGRGNHARQGNVPQQPRLETSEGVASVSFDTSNNSCFALPHVMQNAQGGEIFAILKAAPATDRARGLWMFAYEDSTYGYTTYYPDTNGTIGDRFGSNTLHKAGIPLFDIKQWHLYNVTAATGNWTSRLNGNIQYHSDANTISWHNAPLLGSNGGYGFVGNIAELLVFERVLSGEERALVTAYLNKRHVLDGGAQAPETPSGLTGKIVLGNRAVLDWQGEVSPWIEYELARKEAGGGYVSIARQRGTHYVDLALSPNQTYTYHVRAINAAGTSDYGNEVELQAPPSADPLFPASNLRLWLDADREAGGALIQWTDWSGRDNHGSKGSIPVAICVDEEGRKVARFSSVSGQQSDFGDVLSGATEGEIFIVLKASTNARNPFWSWGNTLAYHPENANALSDGFGRGMTGNYQRVNLGYPIAGLDRKHLYNISSKTGEWVVRLDGGVQYKETGDSHVFAAGRFTLGYAFDGDGWVNRMFSGDIAELLLFDRVLTEAERGTVGKYLQAHHEFVPEKAPETPRNARARAVAANCVDVTWDFISESIDTTLIIERHSGDGDFAVVAKLPHYSNYSWLDTTVEAGAHYTYRLKAVNWFGESPCSDDAGVVVPHEGGGLPVDGLRTWLRSDAGVMRTQEGLVYRWTDQSGKGNHAAQTTASLRPGFGLRTDKARPVVTFDPAKNQYVTFGNIMSGASAGEVFVVLKSNVKTGTTRALWAFGSNSYSYYPNSTGALHDNFGATTARNLGNPTADISLWHTFNVSSRPNEWIARLNGQEQTRLTTNTVGFSGSPSLGRNGSYYFDGEIAEIMVYDRVLDDGERMAVNEYLNARHFSTALPVFVPAPGLYQAPVDVKLTGFGESDEVYYTTDGSEPQRGVSPRYTPGESIHIASVTRLRARAWTGDTGGKVADGMYAFGTEWPVASATSGLAAEFSRSAVFGAETTHARLDSQVDLTKSADVPGGLADAPYSAYAARWAGELLISRTEPHTLTIDVQGGARLTLNGGVVTDQMSLTTSRLVTHTFDATAGDRIPITLEYAKPVNTPAPKITLSWNGVSFSKETIPAASLASGLVHVETLDTPSATPPAGVVLELTEASLSATPASAIIRYTLDGSAPTAESPRYLQPVRMTTDTTIRARAWLDGKNPSGTLVARYTVDHAGPALSNLTFESAPVPATISRSGRFGVTATALAGVSRVEFTLDGQPLGAAVSGNQTFFIAFDINTVADGAHTIAATATDRLGRQSTPLEATFTVAMAPPPAPVITSPSIGDRFSNASVTVKGAAQQNAGITLYLKTSDATEIVAAQTTAGPDGRFSALIQLQPGQNQLSATARNRASQPGERSMTVTVDLDTTAPTEPRNLAARSQAGGRISLSWQAPASGIVSGYRVYRAAAPMTSPDQGTAIGGLITSRAHIDLPEADGAWHYLVVAVKSAADGELAGPPTASVEAVSDRVAPVVSALSYKSAGAPHDQASHRFGAGPVAVSFTTSEALTAIPALTLMTSGGQTMLVSVKRESETAFTGVATIPADAAGEITPVFSGYDAAGNQGTVVENAGPALCDTAGPRVTALQPVTPKPGIPGHDDAPSFTTVKNEPAPVTLYWRVTYDEAPSGTPAFGATVTGGESPRDPLACEMLPDPANAGAWIASLTLPADAGEAAPETLTLISVATDDLGNAGAAIEPPHEFPVYKGDLPPLPAPGQFFGEALPGGEVYLKWSHVEGASGWLLQVRAPGAQAFADLVRITNPETDDYLHPTSADGMHTYRLATLRNEHGDEAAGAWTPEVTVRADSIPPPAPAALALEVLANGIKASWEPPATGMDDVAGYSLYRSASAAPDTGIDGLVLMEENIPAAYTWTTDPEPDGALAHYTLYAVDAAGNRSAPARAEFSTALLPVRDIAVTQHDDSAPVIAWTPAPNVPVDGYRVLRDGGVISGDGLLPASRTAFTDATWNNAACAYTVESVSGETVRARSIALPLPVIAWPADTAILRGIVQSVPVSVTNPGDQQLDALRLALVIDGETHAGGDTFAAPAGASVIAPVVITPGRFLPIGQPYPVTVVLTQRPETGAAVVISRMVSAPVREGAFGATVEVEDGTLPAGGTGRARFTFANTSNVPVSVDLRAVRLDLLDDWGRVIGAVAWSQRLIASAPVMPSVEAGAEFVTPWFEVDTPDSVGGHVTLSLSIDSVFHTRADETKVAVAGPATALRVPTRRSDYVAEITSISPAVSDGTQPIIITGRAFWRSSQTSQTGPDAQPDAEAAPAADVRVGIHIERGSYASEETVTTASDGGFVYTYEPGKGVRGGIYEVWAAAAGYLARPQTISSFEIRAVRVEPGATGVSLLRQYEKTVSAKVTAGDSASLTNARFELDGSLPADLHVMAPAPRDIAAGGDSVFTFTLTGQAAIEGQPDSGTLTYRLVSDATDPGSGGDGSGGGGGSVTWADFSISYSFVEAKPVLVSSPYQVRLGLMPGTTDHAEVSLRNAGHAAIDGLKIALLPATENDTVPAWLQLIAPASSSIEIGETVRFALTARAPAVTVDVDQDYWVIARVTGGGLAAPCDIPVHVTLAGGSGAGSAYFHVVDPYYQYTLPGGKTNPAIDGLPDADVVLEKETASGIPSETLRRTTDARGEADFNELSAGRYRVRVTAGGHDSYLGTVTIKPGVLYSETVRLGLQPITFEWSVTPVTIQDTYDVSVIMTYRTDVPMPVLVPDPVKIDAPKGLRAGQRFSGEFRLTNKGLIKAEKLTIPANIESDALSLEVDVPPVDTLAPGETVRIRYMATARRDGYDAAAANAGAVTQAQTQAGAGALAASGGSGAPEIAAASAADGGGGDCGGSITWVPYTATYMCPDGTTYTIHGSHGIVSPGPPCPPGTGGLGFGWFNSGMGPNAGDDGFGNGFGVVIGDASGSGGGWGGGGGGGGEGGGGGDLCRPGPKGPPTCGSTSGEEEPDKEDKCDPDDDDDDNGGGKNSGGGPVPGTGGGGSNCLDSGSWIDLALREYSDRVTDLGVPTPSGIGRITIEREYRNRRWRMRAASRLDVIRDTAAGIIPVVDDAYYYPGDTPRLAMPEVGEDGTTPVRHTLGELPAGVYRGNGNRIEKKADGTLTWDNGYGATREYDAQGRHVATYIRSMLKATYAYDSDGALQNIKDANGRTIYTFSGSGSPNGTQTVTDLAGRTVTYQWQNGRLMTVTDVMGRTTAYEYGAYGEIIKKIEPAGRTYNYRWQVDVEDGVALEEPVNLHYLPVQVVWMRSPDGQTRTFNWIYDKVADEYHVSMRTNTGEQTDSVISANSTLLSQSVNGVRVYAYQAQVGEASAAIEFTANGNTCHEELDSQDRLIRRTYSDDTAESWTYTGPSKIPATHTGRDGITEKWEYDAAGRMTAHIEAVGTPYERSLRHEYYPGTSLLKTRTDALGRETTYVYDANGLRIETTEPGGVKTTYTRDALGRVTGMTDALGRTWQYQHDAEGRVIAETNPLGVKTLYTYDDAGNLTREETGKFEDQSGRVTTHEYDSSNRLTATYREDTQGHSYLVSATTYDSAGRAASTRDALGVTAIYAYDNQGRPASVTRPTPGGGQIETRTTYDVQGNPTEVRQVLVQAGTGEEDTVMPVTVRYVYDLEGRELVRMEAPDTPLERHTETIYDSSGRVKSVTIRAIGSGWGSDAAVRTTSYTYDTLGRRIGTYLNGELTGTIPVYDTLERVVSETDALGNITTYTYNDAGHVTETKLNGRTLSTMTYDAIGQPVATADVIGNHTHIRHDELGRATHQSITFAPGETAPDNWWTQPKYVLNETIYNVHGEAVTQKRPTVALDNTVTYATTDTVYDDLGRVGAAITPTGLAQQYHYDNASRPIQVTYPAADDTTLQAGESTEYHPTLSSIVLAQVDATGGRTEYTHDALGRAIAIKTPLGGTVTNTYDALGRVTRNETRDTSNTVVASTTTTYNHLDQPLVTTYADGSTEVNTYDASGNLIEKGGNAAYPLRYAYDALGRMATMTDGNNSTTAWAYNDLGQIETKTYADGSVWRYTYTDAGQLATRTWARMQSGGQPLVTTYSYTPSDQLASVAYNDSTTPSVTFTYDQQGRRLTMTTGSIPGSAGISARDAITTDSIYDPAGHLMATADANATITYAYNTHGLRTGMKVEAASSPLSETTYAYDAAGRLSVIAIEDGQTHRYTYHPGTRQLATRASGNVTTTYAYDTGRGMLTSIENKAGSTVVSKYAYTINNHGQRTQVSQSGAAFATPSGYGWIYNTKGEVVAANNATDTTKNRAYNYDPIGNRRWSTEGNPATGTQPESPDPLAAAISEYTSNNLNQYTSVTSAPSVVKTPTHDLDGNMTDTGSGSTYAWDAENRLIRVTKTDGTEVRYAYDGESRRIKREVYRNSALQSATRYLYDGWNVIAEYVGASLATPSVPTTTYTWGNDLSGSLQGAGGVGGLLAKKDHATGSVYRYTYDGNGNVSELIATDNSIVAHYEYDVFGKTIIKQGLHADANVYRFSTKSLDGESALYYYGYRFYDPQFGRWPNRDPIEERGFLAGKGFGELLAGERRFNVYAFVSNAPLHKIDQFGLQECEKCGPDVTQALNNTLEFAQTEFRKLSGFKQMSVCAYIFYNPLSTEDGWDIRGLVMGDHSPAGAGCGEERGTAKTNKCFNTVTVDGNCHYRWSVNYVLYGVAAKLCGIDPSSMIKRVLAYNIAKDIYEGENHKYSKLDWAWAGYWGWSPGRSPSGPKDYSTCKECEKSSAVDFYRGNLGSLKWDQNKKIH